MTLFQNETELSPITLKNYTATLMLLNDGKVPTNPNFLKDMDAIAQKLSKYAINTRRTKYITIVAYLKGKRFPKKTAKAYYDKMMSENESFDERKGEKTDRQKENWIDWKEVVEHFKSQTPGTLEHLTCALFVLQPPRRSQDFAVMKVVPEYQDSMDDKFNYLDWKNKNFIYTKYKTNRKYGKQILPIPPELQEVLSQHFKLGDTFEPFLLLRPDGTPMPKNGMTRLLNRCFPKKIGSTMLRNIFSTDNLGEHKKHEKELAGIGLAMGTSAGMLTDIYTKS